MAITMFGNQRSQGMGSHGIDQNISTIFRYIQLYQQYTQWEYYHNAKNSGASVIWSQINLFNSAFYPNIVRLRVRELYRRV